MALKWISGPTDPIVEPISAELAKAHCKIIGEEENDLIELSIKAARRWIEALTNRILCQQIFRLTMDRFPLGRTQIFVNATPLISMQSLKYYDADGTQQTWSAGNYVVDSESEPPRIGLAAGISWPAIAERINAVEVNFTAGLSDANSLDPLLKRAMLWLIAHQYDQRSPVLIGTITTELEHGLERIRQLTHVPARFGDTLQLADAQEVSSACVC